MNITITHLFPNNDQLDRIELALSEIKHALNAIYRKEAQIMGTLQEGLDTLETRLNAINTVGDSVEALLVDLNAKYAAAIAAAAAGGATPAQLAQLTALNDGLDARTTKLAAAVVNGTPAA